MSTNEQNKTQEINENGNQIFKTNNFLGNKPPNLFESNQKIAEEEKEGNGVETTLSENEDTVKNNEKSLRYNKVLSANKDNYQLLASENKNIVELEDSEPFANVKDSGPILEDPEMNKEMSRLNIAKSRLPNKTKSKSALPHNNSKLPGELSGQPSVKNTKEDTKYYKNREQELLSKIAELESKVVEKDAKSQSPLDSAATQIQEKLENDLVATTKEKENYKNRLQTIEKELYNKQKEISTDTNFKNLKNSDEIINHLKAQNEDLRNALAKMTAILRDKTTMCISQEKKIAALMNQVESLKEVVAITKDLLNIRNMEVQHLSNDISAMEAKIDCERQRHNQMLIKMDEAVKLNSELKKEYENQLKLFQHLRDSYEEKIFLLSREGKIEPTESVQSQKNSTNNNISNSQA